MLQDNFKFQNYFYCIIYIVLTLKLVLRGSLNLVGCIVSNLVLNIK